MRDIETEVFDALDELFDGKISDDMQELRDREDAEEISEYLIKEVHGFQKDEVSTLLDHVQDWLEGEG